MFHSPLVPGIQGAKGVEVKEEKQDWKRHGKSNLQRTYYRGKFCSLRKIHIYGFYEYFTSLNIKLASDAEQKEPV